MAGTGELRGDTILSKVNNFVSLRKEEIQQNNEFLKEVIQRIVDLLKKQDELFREFFSRPMFVGSFYKGTKVAKPEEFDLNLIINLPIDMSKIKIENSQPGFAKIKLSPESLKPIWGENGVLKKWRDGDGYLNNEKVRGWFEGIIHKSFDTLEKGPTNNTRIISSENDQNQYQVKVKKSGPAFTLIVLHTAVDNRSTEFHVDLVPVVEFASTTTPPLPIFQQKNQSLKPQFWYLVPKPVNNGKAPHNAWRYCFYNYEKEMLKRNGSTKPVIKQIKKLRDTQKWSVICSYHIESLFFHVLGDDEETDIIFKNKSQIHSLMHMLKKLKTACSNKSLSFYWDKKMNMFETITAEQMSGVANRLDKIIKDIESNQKLILEYFLETNEKEQLDATNIKLEGNGGPPLISKVCVESRTHTSVILKNDVEILKKMVLTLTDEVCQLKSIVQLLVQKIDKVDDNVKILTRETSASGILSLDELLGYNTVKLNHLN